MYGFDVTFLYYSYTVKTQFIQVNLLVWVQSQPEPAKVGSTQTVGVNILVKVPTLHIYLDNSLRATVPTVPSSSF